MPPNDPLMENLDGLRRLEPPAGSTAAAMAAARGALQAQRGGGERRWTFNLRRWAMRVTVSGAVAACVVAGALVWMAPPRPASAAEQLREVVEKAKAYGGWVHVVSALPVMQGPRGGQGGRPPGVPVRIVHHTSRDAGVVAEVREYEQGMDVTWYDRTKREVWTYLRGKDEVRVGTLTEQHLQQIDENFTPPTRVQDLLTMMQKNTGREPASITSAAEGAGTRIDVALFESEEAHKQFEQARRVGMPRQLTLWVDGQKRITKIGMEGTVGKVVSDVTYGAPEPKDVYDLGVPRQAKVVDNRLSDALSAVTARVDARAKKGLGDFTAVVTHYGVDGAGKASTDFGYATVYAVQGGKWLMSEYRLLANDRTRETWGNTVFTEPPEGWPAPAAEQLLPALLKARPSNVWVFNGRAGLHATLSSRTRTLERMQTLDVPSASQLFPTVGLADRLWPGQSLRGMTGVAHAQLTLVREEGRPGLVGVRSVEMPSPASGREHRSETVRWLDPAKDDLIVEEEWQMFQRNEAEVTTRTKKQVLAFGQIAGTNQWYPARWREVRMTRDPRTWRPVESTTEYQLQMLPGLRLEDAWFESGRLWKVQALP